MRLFQVTVPMERSEQMMDLLHARDKEGMPKLQVFNVNKLMGTDELVFFFRVQNSNTIDVLSELQSHGFGSSVGHVDIIPIETSAPWIEDTGNKKSSRKERLPLEAIYQNVKAANSITFDFVGFLITASVIAGMGLITNNPVVVVASMLVSPMMGPILAVSLGILVHDRQMVKEGIKNEAFAVTGAVLSGVVMGFPVLPFGEYFDFPTLEMSSRGVWPALIVGVVVASVSGIAVALTLTSGGIASLVGVAISASLLPPAVNSGLSFVYAMLGPVVHGRDKVSMVGMLIIAGISFLLVIVNIMCINIFATVTLALKDVAPFVRNDDLRALQRFRFMRLEMQQNAQQSLYNEDTVSTV
eukprot:TRINITY_DN632_c1_g1_i1.p1 TRINITY_DN632_c1_g1~~TRINITY_DN632_c1_g1_i1.p1  ORF type:complete len:408 (-),score=165.72 TRINITY_DN632_c1_g1_i1:271-1338(-)